MSWRQDSSAGAYIYDTQVPVGQELLGRDEELTWLMRDQRKSWRLINGRIARSGDPIGLEGLYGGLTALPPQANAPTVAVTATATPGVALWTTTLYTPIPNNAVMAPSVFTVMASGTVQTSTTSMTTTVLPGVGNVVEAAAPSTFKTLGPSGVATLATTALTAIWYLQGTLLIQQVGTAGTAVFTGTMTYTTAAPPATNAQTAQVMCGGTQATAIDFTGTTAGYPGGFMFAAWASASTVTYVPQLIALGSWN
jgi:hypothetical protein